jgi:hypothetical protein
MHDDPILFALTDPHSRYMLLVCALIFLVQCHDERCCTGRLGPLPIFQSAPNPVMSQ